MQHIKSSLLDFVMSFDLVSPLMCSPHWSSVPLKSLPLLLSHQGSYHGRDYHLESLSFFWSGRPDVEVLCNETQASLIQWIFCQPYGRTAYVSKCEPATSKMPFDHKNHSKQCIACGYTHRLWPNSPTAPGGELVLVHYRCRMEHPALEGIQKRQNSKTAL